MNEQEREELIALTLDTWGESYEITDALIAFLGDKEEVENVLKNDLSSNRYVDCYNWIELADSILDDECFLDMEMDELAYVSTNEEHSRKFLIDDGWCLDMRSGVAIALDCNVKVQTREVKNV